MNQSVLHRQNATPAVAKEVKVGRVHAQGLPDLLHFLHPTLDVPEVCLRLVTVETSQLVVHVHFRVSGIKAFVTWQLIGHVQHVLVRACRSAVQHQHLDFLTLAKLLCEHFESVAQLHHGHALLLSLGLTQRSILRCERHGAVACLVVVPQICMWAEIGVFRAACASDQQGRRRKGKMESFHEDKMAQIVEQSTGLGCLNAMAKKQPEPPTTQLHRAALPWQDWPAEDLDRIIQMAWEDRTLLRPSNGNLG